MQRKAMYVVITCNEYTIRKVSVTSISFYNKQSAGSQTASFPDSKVYGANMEPIWDRQDPGGPHVGPMSLVIWVCSISLVQQSRALLVHEETDCVSQNTG